MQKKILEYVSFKAAKKLKEIGFNEDCNMAWVEYTPESPFDRRITLRHISGCNGYHIKNDDNDEYTFYAAPTITRVQEYIRELTHNKMFISIDDGSDDYVVVGLYVKVDESNVYENIFSIFSAYNKSDEEAFSRCIDIAMTHIDKYLDK